MLDDLAYKLVRKYLPRRLYKSISWSFVGRAKNWHKIENYAAAFKFYQENSGGFQGKRIVEVGCGEQFYTAFYFLSQGAAKVLLAEPKLGFDEGRFASELDRFNRFASTRISQMEARGKISIFRDLSGIPPSEDGRADIICSYLVLEHFQEIESFFRHVARLLASDGKSCNLVDLSDHTYHFIGNFKALNPFATERSLFHLRYSDRAFAILNDPKCYINRKLLPEYLGLAGKYGLAVAKLEKTLNHKAVLNPDLVRRHPTAAPDELRTVLFSMTLGKS